MSDPTTTDAAPSRVRCEACGGHGGFRARGGTVTSTCPLPPEGCGGFGCVDPSTPAAIPRAPLAPPATPDMAATAASPLSTCCVKGCAVIVIDGDICQAHVDEIDRRLTALAGEAGIPIDRVYAKLGAYCDEQAKRRVRA